MGNEKDLRFVEGPQADASPVECIKHLIAARIKNNPSWAESPEDLAGLNILLNEVEALYLFACGRGIHSNLTAAVLNEVAAAVTAMGYEPEQTVDEYAEDAAMMYKSFLLNKHIGCLPFIMNIEAPKTPPA